MVLQYGIKLAFNLISAHFGDLVARVCDCLLRKGTLTLPELIRYTELPPQQVKNCLLVLIQHNCVQAFTTEKEGGFGVAPKVITQYTTIFENILHRMRFSKFLAIVSEELDKECEELLEGLLQHGRLTLEQIILRAISKQNDGNSNIQDALRASFVKLVNAHYVERCPASEPFLAPPSEDETPSTARRGAKSAKLVEEETVEQRAITVAAPSDGERFAIVIDSGTDVTAEAKSEGNPSTSIGEKRKHEALEMDREAMATICEKEVLWRANFEEFVRHLRHELFNIKKL
ncbi:RNA polymerase III Rpc82 [Macleaya cordata]|uniref:DNA-directed RNA polymerase III subunit RPC3 n=1 Tax=Macleaya cordata TaxID=56857 RepID=A0A200PTX0_MACCD|nr:RNA polymerase III Rpc82 [Macleaya cordata]